MSTPAAPESKPSLRPLILVLLGLVAVVVVLRLGVAGPTAAGGQAGRERLPGGGRV